MTEKHHRGAVSLKQTVGEFLIRRLKEAGISHMFGAPGDCNLEFLGQLETDKELARHFGRPVRWTLGSLIKDR